MLVGPVRLWFSTRRAVPLTIWLAVLVVIGVLLGPRSMDLPALVGSRGSNVLLSAFVPMLWAAAIADTFAARTYGVEARPARRVGLLDAGLFLSATGAAAALYDGVVVGPAADGVGPVLITSGVAVVVVLRRTAAAAAFVVSAAVLVTSVYGPDAPGAAFVRLLQGDGDARASYVVGLFACGVACWLLVSNRVNTRVRGSDPDR